MKPTTFRHRVEFLGYRIALGVLGALPEGWALRLGSGVGWVAGIVLGIRRRVVQAHLLQAFPDKPSVWRRRVAGASFRHFGREFLASFLLGRMSRKEILDRTQFVGFGPLQEAVDKGLGAVVVTAHFGNWEIAGAALALRGIPLDVVAQRQRNPLFNTELTRVRTELGMRVILRGDALREGLRSLRKGRALALLGDQNLRRGGVFVDFLGKKASTARGAAVLALRVGCPMFFGVSHRLPGYPPRYRVEIVPVEFTPSGDKEADAIRLTEIHTRLLEEQVLVSPEQYFWQHRRWKTQPSDVQERE